MAFPANQLARSTRAKPVMATQGVVRRGVSVDFSATAVSPHLREFGITIVLARRASTDFLASRHEARNVTPGCDPFSSTPEGIFSLTTVSGDPATLAAQLPAKFSGVRKMAMILAPFAIVAMVNANSAQDRRGKLDASNRPDDSISNRGDRR